jgi:SAM-dependent methyltransferase
MKEAERTREQIREHYEVEKRLAERLRSSTRQERQRLYNSIYDELFTKIPHHPSVTKKSSPEQAAKRVAYEMRYIQPFLKKDSTFLEVGAGDCALSLEVAKFVKTVYSVEVSEEIARNCTAPRNFTLVISDGTSIPVQENTVDVAYSNQLMEHLHPEDALDQLRNIYKALVRGGVYICITPSRLNGPHDISRDFDTVATGLHLKEYSVGELHRLFKDTGFSKVRTILMTKRIRSVLPPWMAEACERLLSVLPYHARRSIASGPGISRLLGIAIVGMK